MKIEVQIDKGVIETRVIIVSNRMDEEVNQIIARLGQEVPSMIAGFKEDVVCAIEPKEILRIYASDGKVYAQTKNDTYRIRSRLYEMEKRLDSQGFVRISNSEIIQLRKVKNFDLSITGTICIVFQDGTRSYVSRRYVSKIKQILGL